jgi:hypothetical protein
MAEVSFAVSTIGLIIPFCLYDPIASATGEKIPISNAIAITSATWVAHNGRRRPLTLSQAISATFVYQVSAMDSRTAHIEEGYLEICFAENVFATSSFQMCVFPHF